MLQANLERCAAFLSACPCPKKVEFRSPAKARKRARQLGMNYYKCVCGSWHLTSKVPRVNWAHIDERIDPDEFALDWRDMQ